MRHRPVIPVRQVHINVPSVFIHLYSSFILAVRAYVSICWDIWWNKKERILYCKQNNINRSFHRKSKNPNNHLPVVPSRQVHINEPSIFAHLAPFSQGELTQGSSLISQLAPVIIQLPMNYQTFRVRVNVVYNLISKLP